MKAYLLFLPVGCGAGKPKLLDQIRQIKRLHHCGLGTDECASCGFDDPGFSD